MADYAVRAATLDDLEALTDIYNHYVVNTAITFDLRTFAAAERREWFDDHRDAGPHRLLVATDARNRCVGYASSSRWRPKPAYDTTVETSVYCHPEALGRGCGTALYAALFAVLASEDVHRVGCRRQPAESRFRVASRKVRLSPRWGLPLGRPEVRQVLGRRLVRASTSGATRGQELLQGGRAPGLISRVRTRRRMLPSARATASHQPAWRSRSPAFR